MPEQDTLNDLAQQILLLARNTLMVNLRFMENALGRFQFVPVEDDAVTYRVDGQKIEYNAKHVLTQFKESQKCVNRSYLHMVLHCVFRHEFVSARVDHNCWSLAADISVENLINSIDLDCTRTEQAEAERSYVEELRGKVQYLTAECIYDYLLSQHLSVPELQRLNGYFIADDHTNWFPKFSGSEDASESSSRTGRRNGGGKGDRKDGNERNDLNPEDGIYGGSEQVAEDMPHFDGTEFEDDNVDEDEEMMALGANKKLQEQWEKIAQDMQTELETFGATRGVKAGDMVYNLEAVNREKYDYEEFLKKFSGYGEEITTNDEEFDNNFYTYGLRIYENMPLIEPLEYKEMKKIRDFVIAVDTSGSVMGEVVQKFIHHTYTVLKSQENFFHKINVHIIQCDAEIQEDAKITSQEEFDEYMKTMKLRGFGGTDFRPVFHYVDELIAKHEFTNLKGLIYFTDGFGTFPEQPPSYRAAFVYLNDYYANPDVPPWAIRLVLRTNEI